MLHVDRIDHGNRALEDAAWSRGWRTSGMTLTVCPLSNLKLCVVRRPGGPPARSGCWTWACSATVNSDDPAYFGGYLGEN